MSDCFKCKYLVIYENKIIDVDGIKIYENGNRFIVYCTKKGYNIDSGDSLKSLNTIVGCNEYEEGNPIHKSSRII